MARRRVSKRTNNMEIGHAQDLHRTASASASNSVMYADGSILVASGNALFDQQGKAGAIAFLFRRGKIQTERYRQSNTLATTETFLARINVRDNPCTSLRASEAAGSLAVLPAGVTKILVCARVWFRLGLGRLNHKPCRGRRGFFQRAFDAASVRLPRCPAFDAASSAFAPLQTQRGKRSLLQLCS